MSETIETIDDIIREMRDDAVAADAWCETHGEMASAAPVLNRHADRILAAHNREIAAKDEEMLNLRKSLARVMEVTGDCRKCEECGDETCPWFGEPDGCNNREGRALFLAGKLVDPLKAKDTEIAKLTADNMRMESLLNKAGETVVELMNKMNAQHAEIARLRKIVNELTDALNIAREARPDLVIIDDPCGLEVAK